MTAPPTTIAPRGHTTVPRCSAQACDGLVDGHVGGRFCVAHRRALALTASVTDALSAYVNGIKARDVDADMRGDVTEAGSLIAMGLGLLIGTAFGNEIEVGDKPIRFYSKGTEEDSRPRWRIEFQWQAPEGKRQ